MKIYIKHEYYNAREREREVCTRNISTSGNQLIGFTCMLLGKLKVNLLLLLLFCLLLLLLFSSLFLHCNCDKLKFKKSFSMLEIVVCVVRVCYMCVCICMYLILMVKLETSLGIMLSNSCTFFFIVSFFYLLRCAGINENISRKQRSNNNRKKNGKMSTYLVDLFWEMQAYTNVGFDEPELFGLPFNKNSLKII